MSAIGKLWAGKLYGTNIGNLFVEFQEVESNSLSGTLRFLDDRFGAVVYSISGTFDGAALNFKGTCTTAPDGIQVGEIDARGTLTPEGQLRGSWSSSIGTGGIFHLFPHDTPAIPPVAIDLPPEQLHSTVRQIGAVRLYAEDVRATMSSLAKDFKQGKVVATYRIGGSEVSKYQFDFETDFAKLPELRYLRLTVQEPEAYGINRFASVEFNSTGANEVRVQGIQQSWVLGKAEFLVSELRPREKFLATSFRKFGLNINGLLAILTIILLPELSLARRFVLVAVVFGVAAGVYQLHARFIPNALLNLSDKKPGRFERAVPQILSWLIAATSALVAAIAYGLLKGELPPVGKWFGG